MTAEYTNRIQLYLENSIHKYPLEDDTSSDIAKDIILDLCITAPSGTAMYLTNLIRTDQYLFASIENDSGAVAHFFTAAPRQFRMEQLTMHMDGYGWMVFGPGINGRFRHERVRERIDSRCILPNQRTVRQFKLEVNGVTYDMPNVLNISVNDYIGLSRQIRQIAASGSNPCAYFDDVSPALPHTGDFRDTLVLQRNDSKLSDSIIRFGLTLINPYALPLLTLNNMPPDKDGNIDIRVATEDPGELAWLVNVRNQEETPIGFMLATRNMHGCKACYRELYTGGTSSTSAEFFGLMGPGGNTIKKSDIGEGVPYALPLDCIFGGSSASCPETYPGA